jgi:hypothetical protein
LALSAEFTVHGQLLDGSTIEAPDFKGDDGCLAQNPLP